MQECETGTGSESNVKRVTVRSGGAGHAHSGIVRENGISSGKKGDPSLKGPNGKIVRLGR